MTGQMRPDDAQHAHRGFHHMPEDERRKFQNPEAILSEIGLKSGDTFIDIGCGDGFFALPAAKIVGKKGLVYGVDTDRETISRLEKSVKQVGLFNIQLRVAEAENTIFCTACADVIFFGIVLHDFREPDTVLRNAHTMLKPSGKLADFDWKKMQMPFGPPLDIRFSEEKAGGLIESAGFTMETVKNIPPYNYLIIARPKLLD